MTNDSAGTQPPLLYPPYQSSVRRAPTQPLLRLPANLSDFNAPVYGYLPIGETDHDLTRQSTGEPQGQRIAVSGRVLDEDGRPVRHTLVELWQANAAGRYRHVVDNHPAPLDPHFTGSGRTMTDGEGRYRFVTDQARRVSVAQSPECLAAGPSPLLAVRHVVSVAPRHADVLPERSALSLRPDVPVDRR